jgi:cysteine desulfurase / selenocysteine lyase
MHRRMFLASLGTSVAAWPPTAGTMPSRDVAAWRREFPALAQSIDGQALAYLDSAATTQRPRAVIAAITRFYEADNANPSATLHALARRAAQRYGEARARVARFINATDPSEVVFTSGTTESINLVASAWGPAHVQAGDEIVLTIAEHYSNLLPWRTLAHRTGARIRIVGVDDEGRVNPQRVRDALTNRTRLIAFSHVSNVLGLVNPAAEIGGIAQARGIPVLIDAAQSAPHLRLDVQTLGCDFLAFSSHKMLGPMGVGVLWAKRARLDEMPPYQSGSHMAHDVDETSARLEEGAMKFQAGTPDVPGPVGLAAAIDVLSAIGSERLQEHDDALTAHALQRFREVPGLRLLGTREPRQHERLPIFTFTLNGISVRRIASALDAQGIAIRGGDMAALPLLKRFGITEAARASCYLYTTTGEIDRMIEALRALTASRG